MGISDLLRRLSNGVFGWPKIDESCLVLPDPQIVTTISVEQTPISTYAPLILLCLMHDPEGLPGPKIIQDIGNTLKDTLTAKDGKFCETDYGHNFLWTQSVRDAAKELASRGLIVIEDKDVWRILHLGFECGKRIYKGENDAWLSFSKHVEYTLDISGAGCTEETPVNSSVETVDDFPITTGEFSFCKEAAEESTISRPDPKPLGCTKDGQPYHTSTEVNAVALWYISYRHGNAVTHKLTDEVFSFYADHLTARDNEMMGSRTQFKRHIANLLHDLKRQKLISYRLESDDFRITEKGFMVLASFLKKHAQPSVCLKDY